MNYVDFKKFVLQMAYGLDHSLNIIQIQKFLSKSEKMREKFIKKLDELTQDIDEVNTDF